MAARNSLKSGGWTTPRATRDDEEKRAERKPAAGLVAVKSSPKSEPAEKPAEKPAPGAKNSIRAGGGASAANSAYVANLRKQAADRAATEQRNYTQVTGNRPGLPNTGGGEDDEYNKYGIKKSKIASKAPTAKEAVKASGSWANDLTKSVNRFAKGVVDSNFGLGDLEEDSILARGFTEPPAGVKVMKETIPGPPDAVLKKTPVRSDIVESRKSNVTPVFREMTWDEYNALDAETRGAVDANSLLKQATLQDKALLDTLDVNRDGRVSYAEGRADYGADSDTNYGDNYRRAFARGTSYADERQADIDSAIGLHAPPALDELTYAPNTLAALNLMGVNDGRGSLDEYLNGSAFITEEDIAAGSHKRKEGSNAWDSTPGRADLITRVSEGMARTSEKFDSGEAVIDGQQKAVSISGAGEERLSQLVAGLRRDMAAGASFDFQLQDSTSDVLPTRVDLSALDDPDYAERRGYLDLLYSNIQAQEGEGALLNKEKILPFLEEEGSSWGEWQRLVADRKRYGKTRDYESSASYLGDAREQVMAQVEQIIAQGGSVTDEEIDAWINGLSQEMLNQNRKGK